MIIKYSVGLDISGEDFKACICTIDQEQMIKVIASSKFANSKSGFQKLETWINAKHRDKQIPLSICMESTGVYYENCALYLSMKAFRVCVVVPNKAKKYMQALGLKSKNDKIDAMGLARMGAEQSLVPWAPISEFFYRLRSMTRHHQSLQEQKTVYKNQLHAVQSGMYADKVLVQQLKKMIDLTDKLIKQTYAEIVKLVNSDEQFKQGVEGICQIKGLGILTVATILAETNGFELFRNYKQLVSFAGYDVIENQSGKHVGKTKISKRGNSRIRRILYMPAFIAVKYQQKPFSDLHERVFERNKIPMKAYVAVQKKLLIMIYYLWKKNEKYDPNFRKNIQEKEQVFASVHV
jgi:transposase